MKILLVGDYSNYHATLAVGLRRAGHKVVVASDGSSFMKTERTLSLGRPLPGPAGGALLYLRMLSDSRLRGYDVVSLIGPAFVELRPSRLRRVYNMLRRYNGAVFLGAVGTDKATMDFLTSADCPLRYSEYFSSPGCVRTDRCDRLAADRLWQQGKIAEWCDEIYGAVDGVTTALYEYHKAMERVIPAGRLAYTGIPVDLDAVQPLMRPLVADGVVNLFLGRHSHRMDFKGTDLLEQAAGIVNNRFPDRCRLTVVENVAFAEYLRLLAGADVVLDQVYSYTPATNALLAMARGQVPVTGAEPEFYDFIGETELRPMVNALPDVDSLADALGVLVENPDIIRAMGARGREFVGRHNSADVVARRHLDFWEALSR